MKWITITPAGVSVSGRTRLWTVGSKDQGSVLGKVAWHAPWRKYCFFPAMETLFEQDCLNDIAGFLESATREHYENLPKVART